MLLASPATACRVHTSSHHPIYPSLQAISTKRPGAEATGFGLRQDLDLALCLTVQWHNYFRKQVGSAVCLSKSQKVPTLWPSNTVSGVFPKKTMKKIRQRFLGTKIYVTSWFIITLVSTLIFGRGRLGKCIGKILHQLNLKSYAYKDLLFARGSCSRCVRTRAHHSGARTAWAQLPSRSSNVRHREPRTLAALSPGGLWGIIIPLPKPVFSKFSTMNTNYFYN